MFAFHLAKDGQRLVTRTLLTESLVDDRGKVEVLGQKLLDSREYVRIDSTVTEILVVATTLILPR